jgi:hypothetical protein
MAMYESLPTVADVVGDQQTAQFARVIQCAEAEGKTAKEVVNILKISTRTVKSHKYE